MNLRLSPFSLLKAYHHTLKSICPKILNRPYNNIPVLLIYHVMVHDYLTEIDPN